MIMRFINRTTGEVVEVDNTTASVKDIADLKEKGFELMSISGEEFTIEPDVEELKDDIFADIEDNIIDEDLEEIHNEIREELRQEVEEEYQDIIEDIEDEYREVLKDEYESAFEPDYLD